MEEKFERKSYGYNKGYAKKYMEQFKQLQLRVTADEQAMIKQMASEAGKSVNQFIKDCIFGEE